MAIEKDFRALNAAFANFRHCADDAPDGTYEYAKEKREFIGDFVDNFMREAKARFGVKLSGCDDAHLVEAVLYAWLKDCDTNWSQYAAAEGFGEHVNGPARERVLENAKRDRDFLRSLSKAEGR